MPVALPQIADVALRRNLPQGQLGARYASAADTGGHLAGAIEGAGQALGQYAEVKRQDDERLANFQRETELTEFAAAEQERLALRSRDLADGGQGFTAAHMKDFDATADGFLAKVPERDKEAWRQRMAALRAGVAQDALRAELGERDRYYGDTVATGLDKLLTSIDRDPETHDAALEQGRRLIDASGLSAAAKQTLLSRWETGAAKARAAAKIERDPQGALQALNGALDDKEKDAAAFFAEAGWSPAQVAGIVGNLIHESGGLNTEAAGDGGSAIGLAQWRGERRKALEKFAAKAGASASDFKVQLAFVQHELETGESAAAQKLRAATTPAEAAAAFLDFERPQGWKRGGKAEAVHGWAERLKHAERLAGGDPALAALDYDDRRSLREAAEREIDRRGREADLAERKAYGEQLNTLQLAVMDGEAGQADIDAARKAGWLKDAGDIVGLQNMLEQKKKEGADLDFFNAAVAAGSGFAWNKFDDDQHKAIEAGWRAKGGTLEAAAEIFQQTGMMPKPVASMLRGGLVSTDKQRVKAAATVAANAVARDPNAFAGVEGGVEIAKAAVAFNHYVEDLNYSVDEAADKVAKSNDPAYRPKVADAELKSFQTKLSKEAPSIGSLSQGGGAVASETQKTEMLGAWRELVLEHYKEFGDAGLARKWATSRMQAFYGKSNGRVTVYPPEHRYPAGPDKSRDGLDGSDAHDYLYEQAAADVKTATGLDVAPRDIHFVPIPGVTADDWKRGKPPRYRLAYLHRVDGVEQWDTLPGFAFVGDVKAAQAFQTAEAARRKRGDDSYAAYQRGARPLDERTGAVQTQRGPLR